MMPARPAGALLAAILLVGCTTREPAADTGSKSATPTPAAPACEQLPPRSAPTGADALPPLTLPCLGPGPDVALDRLTGRPTLVNLWATWCGPCREEMPLIQDAFARYGDDVRFLGVDVQDDSGAARSFLDEFGIGYPHAVDADGDLMRELGVRGLPVTLAVDGAGRIVARSVGELAAEDLQRLIDSLVAPAAPDGGS